MRGREVLPKHLEETDHLPSSTAVVQPTKLIRLLLQAVAEGRVAPETASQVIKAMSQTDAAPEEREDACSRQKTGS